MAMTATATPTSQAVTEWTKVFPKQITENYTSSVTFMKQLTVIAVSTITYLKNAFPEESYSMENFGGLKLRILKKKCRDELAHFLSTALTQAFEAFDKKYLHQLAICFYENECSLENLIEYHVFEYSYNTDGVTMSVHSKTRDSAKQTMKYSFDSVRERTVHLIRACVVIMQTCQYELPESYDVSLRLYYNEDAPEGYQAPGFNSAPESEDHLDPTLPDTIKLGCVETPYHKLTARSYIKDSMGASHEAIPSQNAPVMTQMEHDDFIKVDGSSVSECSEPPLRCACNKRDADSSGSQLLLCTYCNSHQHAACYGLMPEDMSRVTLHCCVNCSDEDVTRVPTDPRLVVLSVKKRECLCIFRRTLELCSRSEAMFARRLTTAFGISDTNAVKLMKLLHSHGIIKQDSDTDLITPRKISTDRLKSVINKFFQVSEEGNIVDRLLAETFASQDSLSDPVGDVLSPLEKVSLQDASNLGRVIETPVDTNPTDFEDLTLKQYKEALLSNYQAGDDLPPHGPHNPIKDIENIGSKRTSKRKITDELEEGRPRLRTGVRTKRAKAKA